MKAAAFSPRWMRDTGVHPQGQQAPAENAASPWSVISWDRTTVPTTVAFCNQKRGQQTTVGSLWSQLQTNKPSTFLGIPNKDSISRWMMQAEGSSRKNKKMLGSFSPATSVGKHPQEHQGDENQAKASTINIRFLFSCVTKRIQKYFHFKSPKLMTALYIKPPSPVCWSGYWFHQTTQAATSLSLRFQFSQLSEVT